MSGITFIVAQGHGCSREGADEYESGLIELVCRTIMDDAVDVVLILGE